MRYHLLIISFSLSISLSFIVSITGGTTWWDLSTDAGYNYPPFLMYTEAPNRYSSFIFFHSSFFIHSNNVEVLRCIVIVPLVLTALLVTLTFKIALMSIIFMLSIVDNHLVSQKQLNANCNLNGHLKRKKK